MKTQKTTNKRFIALLTILLFSTFLWSCGDDSTDPMDGNSAVLKGRVTTDGGYGTGLEKAGSTNSSVEGAVVTVSRIESNGSLTAVSDTSVYTDSDGEFELEIEATGEVDLLITATKGTSEWKAVVSVTVNANAEIYVQPLNVESTAEAEVYVEAAKNSETDVVTYNEVAFYVNADIAAKIVGNTTAVQAVKNALVIRANTEKELLVSSEFGYSSSDVSSIKEVEVNAQAELESDLYFSTDNESSYDVAWESYFSAVINGYSNASITLNDYAKARETAGTAMINLSSGLDSDIQLQLRKRDAYLKAVLVTEAMVNEYAAAGANTTQQAQVRTIGNTLKVSIKSATSVTAINQAYAEFTSSVEANIQVTFSAALAAYAKIQSTITGTIKAALKTAIAAAANIDAVVNGYLDFYVNVESTIDTNMSGTDDSQLEIYSNIFALIYMHN